LIVRINAVADEARSLLTAFQGLTDTHLIAQGMDRATMQARADEIYREWTAGV
jgi:hypothetical protein